MSETIKRHDKPLGASGTDVVSNVHNSEDHIEALQGYQAALFYDKMRRSDTQVRKILGAITSPIKSARWGVEPFDDDARSLEIANTIETILFKDIKWSKFINEALTVVAHGHSVFEVVHENKVSREIGPYTGLAQLGFRRQPTIIEWHHDKITGELKSIKQESATDIEVSVVIPAEFLLCFFSEQEGDNIGFPLLRNVYGPYKRKLLAMELQFIGIERFAIPTPMLQVPKGIKPTDLEYIAAVETLKAFVSAEDSYLMFPEGWELNLHDNSFDPEKLKSVIKGEDENMSGAILASFLELGTGGNTGAYALSNDLSDFFFAGLSYYANVIRDTINDKLIPQLVSLNYGPDETAIPKINYSGIADKAGLELMQIITGFIEKGVISSDEGLEDYIRKAYNLPKKAEGTLIENEGAETVDASTAPPEEIQPLVTEDVSVDEPAQLSEILKFAEKTPKKLMEKYDELLLDIIRRHLTTISDKYIADTLRNYKSLSDKNKMAATKDVKVGGVAQFKKELKGALTSLAREALDQVEAEVGISNVKFKEDEALILKDLGVDTFKFNEFSKLPKRIQLIIASQADLISAKESEEVTNAVAFQFGSSEPSTNDIDVIREDLKTAAAAKVDSGTKKTVAANTVATVAGHTRNQYLLDDEVQTVIESYTFVNSDPQTDICKALAGTTYDVLSTDIVRYQPPLHHNCKSYMRANLKTSKNKPEITGLPTLTDSARKSITFKDGI